MSCYNCGGSGYVITCIDDICRASDECFHGDGEEPCPVCQGEPEDEGDIDDYFEPPMIFRGPEIVMSAPPTERTQSIEPKGERP